VEFKHTPLGGDRHFQTLKERFLVVYSMLRAHPDASVAKKERVAGLIFTERDLKGAEDILVEHKGSQNNMVAAISSLASAAFSSITTGSALWSSGDARTRARRMSEGDFMMKMPTLLVEEPALAMAASQIGKYFMEKLRDRVHILADRWTRFVSRVEVDALNRRLQLEATALHDKNRSNSRAKLLHELSKVLVQRGHPK
jgi:hypothetical protein